MGKVELYFIAGTKGGIGKSTMAALIAEIARDKGREVEIFDCDNENRSLVSAFEAHGEDFKLHVIDPDSEDKAFPLDDVINRIAEETVTGKVFVVDMKAGTSFSVQNWFKSVPVGELAANGVKINVVGCLTSDVESVNTFGVWVDYFLGESKKGNVRFVVVKNMRDGKDFSHYEQRVQKILESYDFLELSIPKFEGEYLEKMKRHKTTLGKAAKGEAKLPGYDGFMDLNRMRRYYEDATKEIEKLFGAAADCSEGKKKK